MMQKNWKLLQQIIPSATEWRIDWDRIEHEILPEMVQAMVKTEQNPQWHAEGNVWTHTKMVCEKLVQSEQFRNLERKDQEEVFVAALLHDIGKIKSTKVEKGILRSMNHTIVGEEEARKLLLEDFQMKESENEKMIANTISLLIRYHSAPLYFKTQKNAEKRIKQLKEIQKEVSDFRMELLYILIRADLKGRISDSIEEKLNILDEYCQLAEKIN